MGIYADKTLLEQKQTKAFIQILNEVYFGRTPGITRCYNAFCDFRQKYTASDFLRGVRHIDVDHDKDLHTFCREMERQFGLESFSFIIENSLTQNMYTIPIVIWDTHYANGNPRTSNIKQFVYADKEGYHFKKEARVSAMVFAYSQMLFNAEYTDEEAFSIVLHEVGHNFQAFLNNDMINLALVRSCLISVELILDIFLRSYYGDLRGILQDIKTTLLISQQSQRGLSKIYNSLTSNDMANNLYSYFNFLRGILSVPTDVFTAICMVPLAPLMGFVAGVVSILKNLSLVGLFTHTYSYLGEQMADNFPTYYGFGKARVTSQLKSPGAFGPLVDGIGKIPIIGHMYNFLLMPAQIMIGIGDEHPANSVRCKAVMDSMKADVNDPRLSPKLRAQLKKEIESCEKEMQNYFNRANDISDPQSFKIFYDSTVFYAFDGGFKYRTYKSLFNISDNSQKFTNNKLMESADVISKTIIK